LSMSSEGEHEGLDAGFEELDLEPPVPDRRRLADELVHPLVVGDAVAVLVDVDAMGAPRGLPIELDGPRPSRHIVSCPVWSPETLRTGRNATSILR
jgi:hypothetical protein